MGSIDLNHPIEVADINSEFQRASRHDHAVLCLGERRLCGSPFLRAERAVGKKRRHPQPAQFVSKLFDPRAAITEYQALFPPMQP